MRSRRKRAVVLQPDLPAALDGLIKGTIRGDPEAPLRWVSRSRRRIAWALGERGFAVSQKLVGLLLPGHLQDPGGDEQSQA